MSSGYEYVLGQHAINLLATLPKGNRDKVVRFLQEIADNPTEPRESILRPPNERPLYVASRAKWAFTYWLDHAAKEVRIVKIERTRG
jgi:hypothetical protein